jgi:hypothetical protein
VLDGQVRTVPSVWTSLDKVLGPLMTHAGLPQMDQGGLKITAWTSIR